MHKNVHTGGTTYKKEGKNIYSVHVFNDDFNVFGVVDSVELRKCEQGVFVGNEQYELTIVEHKPTKPKGADYNFDDALQVFAQKICVDYIFKTNSKGILYYSDVKKRVRIPFEQQNIVFKNALEQMLEEMRFYLNKNKIPPIKKGQKCSGCSFKDICMPKINSKYNVKQMISSTVKGGI